MKNRFSLVKPFWIIALFSFACFVPVKAQTKSYSSRLGPSWEASPYEDKFFVENRGQFDGKDLLRNSQIYYGAHNKGVEMYFTRTGLSYRFTEKKLKPVSKEEEARELEEKKKGKYKENLDDRLIITNWVMHLEWLDANPNAQLITEEKTASYWNYSMDNPTRSIDFVPGFKKLIYKNLYPNIDVEYVFHEKEGIKYTLHLHPGADISKVKMRYKGIDDVTKDAEGSIHMNFRGLGDIVDHAPESFFEDGETVKSEFSLQGNVVSFSLTLSPTQKSKIKNQKLIIDPWVTNPAFTGGFNRGYDITRDVTGNVYIFGGTNSQYECKKFTSAGALVWTYNAATLGNWYGDMALDFVGNIYLASGCCSGGRMTKLNNAGVMQFTTASSSITEMWRLAQDCNYSKLVAGGGVPSLIANVDKNTGALQNFTNLNLAGGFATELRSEAVDPAGNIYSVHVTLGASGALPTNLLVKTNAAFAIQYTVQTGYTSHEYGTFYTGTLNFAGFSGIVIDNNFAYTYNGATIYKRNLTTGAFVAQVAVTGATWDQDGGICLDGCGNVYVGTMNSIRKYDNSLNFLTSVPTTGAVYDVAMGIANEVIATGNGFVGSYTGLSPCQPILNTVITPQNIGCGNSTGSAQASVSGGSGPYTYSWNNGQTTANATGLTAGIYTVTVTDFNGCNGGINTQTVQISGSGGGLAYNVNATFPLCNGGLNGTATATASTGTQPYTYSWSVGGQTTQTATGLSAGTYTVLVTDASGCSASKTVTVTTPPALNVAANPVINATCTALGSATASTTGGTGVYTYSWSANGQTTQSISGLAGGTYTLSVTDANGCTKSTTFAVAGAPGPATSITGSSNPTCFGFSNGSATVSANAGTGAYTYAWSPNGGTGSTGTGLSAGTYTVTVTDNNGCTSTATVTLTQPAAVVPLVNNSSNVSCNGGSNGLITLTTTGGTGAYTYAWSNSQTGANATGLSAGNYSVTVTDANGCTGTTSGTITEPTVLTATANGASACSNATATGSAAGGTTNYNYAWNNGQTTANATGLTTGVYTLVVTDANGCTASDTAIINVSPPPVVVFTVDDTAGCAPLCVKFTCSTANIVSYTWNFGDGSSNTIVTSDTVNHCYKQTGTFSVTLTILDNKGCSSTSTHVNMIYVYPNVVADFTASPQPTTILNPVITFTDLSLNGPIIWKWSFGDLLNSTSNLQNPTFNFKDSGCYNVELFADNVYNCPDTVEKVICINGDYELFAPNAFTPDGSGLNDKFNVKGIGIDPNNFKLWIFDRWGNLIFETTDLNQGWDGRANGGKDIAQQDVYVWKVATRDFLGGKHQYIGHVSLVR